MSISPSPLVDLPFWSLVAFWTQWNSKLVLQSINPIFEHILTIPMTVGKLVACWHFLLEALITLQNSLPWMITSLLGWAIKVCAAIKLRTNVAASLAHRNWCFRESNCKYLPWMGTLPMPILDHFGVWISLATMNSRQHCFFGTRALGSQKQIQKVRWSTDYQAISQ